MSEGKAVFVMISLLSAYGTHSGLFIVLLTATEVTESAREREKLLCVFSHPITKVVIITKVDSSCICDMRKLFSPVLLSVPVSVRGELIRRRRKRRGEGEGKVEK